MKRLSPSPIWSLRAMLSASRLVVLLSIVPVALAVLSGPAG